MLHIIGIPNCNSVRKTQKWMQEKGIEFEFVNVKEAPLTLDELKELEFKVGLDVLLNRKSQTYRNLGLKNKDLSDEEMLEVLHQHQTLIKRPVLVFENSVLVGYDEEAFEQFALENNLIEE